jgi:galactokinase
MSDIAPLRDAASAAVVALFKRHFGHTPPHVVKVPGSVEWLGQFTYLADGLSLSAAIDRFVWVAIAPRSDGRIERKR